MTKYAVIAGCRSLLDENGTRFNISDTYYIIIIVIIYSYVEERYLEYNISKMRESFFGKGGPRDVGVEENCRYVI